MTTNKALLTAIALMTYMVMSGVLTQIGVILTDFSDSIKQANEVAVAIFSYLTGGTLLGTFISLGIYAYFPLLGVLRASYTLFICVMLVLVFFSANAVWLISICFILLGISCGVGLSGGAIIISKIYSESKRASAFIVSDCSFSAAGYIFPSIAVLLFSMQITWVFSYAAVAILASVLLALLFVVKFPAQEPAITHYSQVLRQLKSILKFRVVLMGIGVCAYLIAQTTFLTWAPQYLHKGLQVDTLEAASVVGNYWGLSIFGLLISAVLVHKVNPRWVLILAVILAIAICSFFVFTHSGAHFLLISFAFGFFTSCIYKLAMAVGSQQIANAPAMLITFLLFCGGIGSTLAPLLSGMVVAAFGVKSAIILSLACFIFIALAFGTCLLLERLQKPV